MAYSSQYTYGEDQTPDSTAQSGAPSLSTQQAAKGPAPYQPNQPSQTPPQPQTKATNQQPAPAPQTFSQMQAAGYARPPMPAAPAPQAAPQAPQAPPSGMVYGGVSNNGSSFIPASGQGTMAYGLEWNNGSAPPPNLTPEQYKAWTDQHPGSTGYSPDVYSRLQQSGSAADTHIQLQKILDSGGSLTPEQWDQYGQAMQQLNKTWASPTTAVQSYDAAVPGSNAWMRANPSGSADPNAQYLQGGMLRDAKGNPIPGGYSATADAAQQQAAGSTSGPAPYQPSQSGATSTQSGGTGGGTMPSGSSNGVYNGGQPGDVLSYLTGGAAGMGAGSQVQNATQQKTLDLLNNPSPYGQQDVKDLYNWQAGNIDDQYALQRKKLAGTIAARGLSNSSINAGDLNDLNIGQRSAKESMGQDLAHQYASTLGQYQQGAVGLGNTVGTQAQNNQQSWLQQLMGYGQNAFNNDLATNQQNQNAQQNYQNYILSMLGLGYGS